MKRASKVSLSAALAVGAMTFGAGMAHAVTIATVEAGATGVSATIGDTGKPSCAKLIAPAMERLNGKRPKRSAIAAQADGVPGTVTGNAPYLGTLL